MALKRRYSLYFSLPVLLVAAVSRGEGVHQSENSRDLSFTSCASNCIQNSGCDTSDIKCMCRASRGTFLSDVVTCMYGDCSQPITLDAWLGPLELACDILGQPIPNSAIASAEAAESSASSPDPTTATTTVVISETTVRPSPTSKTTYAATSKATATTSKTSSTYAATSTESRSQTGSGVSSSSTSLKNTGGAGVVTTTTTTFTSSSYSATDVQLSFATSSQTPLGSASTTTTAYAGDPTDSSPFASPINSGGNNQRSSLFAAVMGLAAAVVFGW